ncbi:hypothetical protein C8T65DRAFT_582209, partial [Cerioporus squamosus]
CSVCSLYFVAYRQVTGHDVKTRGTHDKMYPWRCPTLEDKDVDEMVHTELSVNLRSLLAREVEKFAIQRRNSTSQRMTASDHVADPPVYKEWDVGVSRARGTHMHATLAAWLPCAPPSLRGLPVPTVLCRVPLGVPLSLLRISRITGAQLRNRKGIEIVAFKNHRLLLILEFNPVLLTIAPNSVRCYPVVRLLEQPR